MSRLSSVSPSLVFTRIVERLRNEIDGIGEANCYLTLDPDSLPAVPGEFAYAVSPAPSASFQQGRFDGGGNNQATIDWIIVITIHGLDQTDEEGRDTNFLTRSTRGIIDKWLEVAAALSGHDLTKDELPGASKILNQPLFPLISQLSADHVETEVCNLLYWRHLIVKLLKSGRSQDDRKICRGNGPTTRRQRRIGKLHKAIHPFGRFKGSIASYSFVRKQIGRNWPNWSKFSAAQLPSRPRG